MTGTVGTTDIGCSKYLYLSTRKGLIYHGQRGYFVDDAFPTTKKDQSIKAQNYEEVNNMMEGVSRTTQDSSVMGTWVADVLCCA